MISDVISNGSMPIWELSLKYNNFEDILVGEAVLDLGMSF